MNQKQSKRLRKEVMRYAKEQGLSTLHSRKLTKQVKKDFKVTPHNKKKDFTIYETN